MLLLALATECMIYTTGYAGEEQASRMYAT